MTTKQFPENFEASVLALDISPLKLSKALKVVDKHLHHETPSQPVPVVVKVVIAAMRFSDPKFKNFSSN